ACELPLAGVRHRFTGPSAAFVESHSGNHILSPFSHKGVLMTWTLLGPIVMLAISNVFMTFSWYGQFKFPAATLAIVIPVSWGIALFEYCFAVPANRLGHTVYSAAQLKTMQEIITLIVFGIFSVTYLVHP